ncbi:MAG: sigma-54-dependent transcriptional regulator [Candidatus Poribacteria bacterium]
MNPSPQKHNKPKILLVDDMPPNLDILSNALEPEGYQILIALDGEEAIKIARRALPDLILLDVMMPKIDGFETCRRLKQDQSTQDIPVIFVTAKEETESIIKGFRMGGVDYIQRPFEKEELLVRVKTHLKISLLTRELLRKNKELQQEIDKREQAEKARDRAEDNLKTADEHLSLISKQEAQRWGIDSFIGKSKTIKDILNDIRRLQNSRTTNTLITNVLITGESGTGKELIARAIHYGGPRAKGPFIVVNCSAIASELAESELFGHVKGAFTGADKDRKGRFELADGGTLFLDEIGDMPLQLQPKLLRVIEDGAFVPVGGAREKHVDVRILAATNQDLQEKIGQGLFREDLYFRLAQFTVIVPPLRERKEDIPLLTEHFLKMFSDGMGIEQPVLSEEAQKALAAYHFPGNVRELRNIIAYALVQSGGSIILPQHLRFMQTDAVSPASTVRPEKEPELEIPHNLEELKVWGVKRALQICDTNVSEAARLLGTNRRYIYRMLEKGQLKEWFEDLKNIL